MPPQHYVTSRRSSLGPTMIALGIVVIGLFGGALLLHATGTINLPFLTGSEPAPQQTVDRRGKVAVPISIRPIRAYSQITRDDIVSPRTGQVVVEWVTEKNLRKDAIVDPMLLMGRVLRYDKPVREFFWEAQFYPVGTRPGPAAGVPPGKRAMRLAASAVPGLHGLLQGDRFDIVMTVEVEVEEPRPVRGRNTDLHVEGPYAPLHEAEDSARKQPLPRVKRRRAEVRVIVKNGLLVQPIHHREAVGSGQAMLPTGRAPKKPIEELIIAVAPAEVAALNQALAIDAQLQVAIRSGQVTAESTGVQETEIPDIAIEFEQAEPEEGSNGDGSRKVKLVEKISGGKKHIMAVPVEPDDEKKPDASAAGEKK